MFKKLFSFSKTSAFEEHLKEEIPFDPATQIAVIHSSICTGEKVAGFKDKKNGKFTEVMTIRTPEDKEKFMTIYGLDKVTTEY